VRWQSAAATALLDAGMAGESGVALRLPPQSKKIPSARVSSYTLCCFLRFKGLVFRRFFNDSPATEIVFSVTQENDGGYVAECLSHDIFTQGDTWEQLRANVREAVSAYFFDQPKPSAVRLHLVRDELLAGA